MNFFFNITAIFNSFSTELMWVIMLFFCYISILTFLRLFGYVGIFIYCALAVIGANIQVLKTVDFFYSPEPVAPLASPLTLFPTGIEPLKLVTFNIVYV